MALRIVAQIGDQTLRSPLQKGENVLGSDSGCHVCLVSDTVSRRHAVIRVLGDRVEVEDLGSQNGTYIGPRRVLRETVSPGTLLTLGMVPVRIEEVQDRDLEVGISLQEPPALKPKDIAPKGSTATLKALDVFTLHDIPLLVRKLRAGAGRTQMAAAVGSAFFHTLHCSSVEISAQASSSGAKKGSPTQDMNEGVLFQASREKESDLSYAENHDGDVTMRIGFSTSSSARTYQPLIRAALDLILLADNVATTPLRISKPVSAAPPFPEPASIVTSVIQIYEEALQVARGEVSVLIRGESGTGKEVLARYIHAASRRAEGPFVPLNCAALPRDLLESELFGIERGVATGVEQRAGKFEAANEGTLFLDEIADMTLETQARILRALQEREVYRLGGHQPRPARVRVLAATNRDLNELIRQGNFRSDLYHRIATWSVELPPLRNRRADIPNLAAHFLSREAASRGLRIAGISRAAIEVLTGHSWPGNIRELENEISKAVLFIHDGELLDTGRLNPEIISQTNGKTGPSLKEVLEHVEKEQIRLALSESKQNVSAAAKKLDIGLVTLYRRMKALGIRS